MPHSPPWISLRRCWRSAAAAAQGSISAEADSKHPCYCSVQFSSSVVSNSLRSHELQHARPPCPSPIPRVRPNPCPSSRWCHPTISSWVIRFSSCLQTFPASGSFPMSQLFVWGGKYWNFDANQVEDVFLYAFFCLCHESEFNFVKFFFLHQLI